MSEYVDEIEADGVISGLLDDLDLAYREAEVVTRHWAAAMQAGRYETAAWMIPEIQRVHRLVIERIRECRDVLKVQIAERHRRLTAPHPVRVVADPSLTVDSETGKLLAVVMMVIAFLILLRLMTNGRL